jgi:hypothetical protein
MQGATYSRDLPLGRNREFVRARRVFATRGAIVASARRPSATSRRIRIMMAASEWRPPRRQALMKRRRPRSVRRQLTSVRSCSRDSRYLMPGSAVSFG